MRQMVAGAQLVLGGWPAGGSGSGSSAASGAVWSGGAPLWAAVRTAVLGALLAAVPAVPVAAWAGARRRARRARRLMSAPAGAGAGTAAPNRARGLPAAVRAGLPRWLVAELLLLPVGFGLGRAAGSLVPLLAAAAAVVPVRRWRLRRRRTSEARRRTDAVIDLCAGLAAELRSGATPEQALHAVVSRAGPSLARALGAEPVARLAAARYGADVPAAIRLVAELPGGRGAVAVAACWQVTADSGTGLANGLDQLADALRSERALGEEIAGELAGPRTTIAVLAALPLVGIALGTMLGARPVRMLLHTPAGLACLVAGALLEAAGVVWTARIVRTAEAPPPPRPSPPPPPQRYRPRGAVPVEGRPRMHDGCGISRVRDGAATGGVGGVGPGGVRRLGRHDQYWGNLRSPKEAA